MTTATRSFDAVVIGGGFYGSTIAIYLACQRKFRNILLVEQEPRLLARASYHNQARVHNGYHYPRSFTTAFRSRINLPRFIQDWPQVVKKDFTKLYAIARKNSKVTAHQFERFCQEIGAHIEPAGRQYQNLFEPRLIEKAFLVHEYAFDAVKLARWAEAELAKNGVQVMLGARAVSMGPHPACGLRLAIRDAQADTFTVESRYVFNCTYSGLNQFAGESSATQTPLKHEITEMALVQMPAGLEDLGVTVMDGPYFSVMPFPARGLHTLSHVRYTPHASWQDAQGLDPYARLTSYDRASRFDRMIRDTARYMPAMQDARYVDSLFEVKTVLQKNEGDDGRPILFERHAQWPGCYSILGGKIDNIYDVLEKLENETLHIA